MAKRTARKTRTARPTRRTARPSKKRGGTAYPARVKTKVLRRKTRKSKFPVTANPIKRRFGNRFEKFYYLHRTAINTFRRSSYRAHKSKGICVKCSDRRVKGSIFCGPHRKMSRIYNRRRS